MAEFLKSLSRFLLRNRFVSKDGAMLFLAIGAVSVLSILALGATSSVLQEMRLSRALTDSNTSCYSALSFVPVLRLIFTSDDTPAAVTVYDMRKRTFSLGNKTIEADFYDEQSRINIDKTSKETIYKLPGIGGNLELATKIEAANIKLKEELLSIEQITPEAYSEVKDYITVYGFGSVNINTASKEILYLVIQDMDIVEKIMRYRAGDDETEGTEDDGVFSFTAEIIPLLEPYSLTEEQKNLISSLVSSGTLGSSSEYVGCNMIFKQANKKLRTFKIILSLTTGKIVSWQEM